MHFISQIRFNAAKGCEQGYYRIKESFRDPLGKVRCRVMLNIGFWDDKPTPEDVAAIGKCLSYMYEHRHETDLFGDILEGKKPVVREFAGKFWKQMVECGSIDMAQKAVKLAELQARSMIDSATMRHTDAREVGAEWLVLQAVRQLKIDSFLLSRGWTDARVKDALSCLVTRTVYSPSELKSMDIMRENSAICELVHGSAGIYPGYKTVYSIPDELYRIKDELERHLCDVTDNLFNQKNRILLFDLTNFYFEGRKAASRKAGFGRSKEKRSDCRLLVLALCINTDGFIRYSSVLEGNTADPASLPDMIERVIAQSPVASNPQERALVVIDAGIATEKNLERIRSKGYNYLCVSRNKLKDVELKANSEQVVVHDTLKREIRLSRVEHKEGEDYYLQVNSPARALTESSMNRQWRERFEGELQRAKDGLSKKGGTKNYEKVVERIGRAMAHYPSIAKYYSVTYTRSTKDSSRMADIQWKIKIPDGIDADSGIYYLRTNVPALDERTCWEYYNLIRDIECTNRQLKTDLSLRPVYHKTDERSDAHLFFGLLAYWIVNTIRHQLKLKGETCYWTEIVRRMSTQKLVTTEAYNALGQKVEIRQCTEPTMAAKAIYKALAYRDRPFKQRKICSTQDESKKNDKAITQGITSS